MTHGSCAPEPVNILSGLPPTVQHHHLYSLRPAPAIYNVSLTPLSKAFLSILDELDHCESEGEVIGDHVKFDATKLLEAQSDLLLKMAAHIDECYLVLKALQPQVAVKDPHPFTDRWLQQARHPAIANFKREISPYQRYLSPLVNGIKHNQSRLRPILFFWSKTKLPGYYIEGVNADGAVGPDLVIHPTGGAYSHARDLRIHFSSLYLIGNALTKAIRKALFEQQAFRARLLPVSPVEGSRNTYFEIAKRISKLPEYVFPDEDPRNVPFVQVFENESTAQIILEQRPRVAFGFPPGGSGLTASAEGDGHTRQFRFPYLRGSTPPPRQKN